MPHESSALAQEIALLLYFAAMANLGLGWFVEDRIFEAVHRERYGAYRSGPQLLFDVLRRPKSTPGTVGRNWSARMRAKLEPAGDPETEQQRQRFVFAYVVFVVVLFLGLPLPFLAVAVVRAVFPGWVVGWAAVLDLVVIAVWARRAVLARRDADTGSLTRAGGVVGVTIGVVTLAALIGLGVSGGHLG